MNTFENKPSPKLKVETIKGPEGNEVSYCPERGGIITSVKFKGKEVLYLDQATFLNTEENVKGGIPILFPNAGPLVDSPYPNLKQHGFARNKKWEAVKTKDGFSEILKSDISSKEVFPFDFNLSLETCFQNDGSFKINSIVKNTGIEKDLPISMGLHPYFKVSNESNIDPYEQKRKIKFNFKGGDIIEKQIDRWANGKAASIDNPNTPMEIDIPSLGTMIVEISKEYKKVWVWSMPGKDFICVEPIMRDAGGLINDPEIIKPGESFSSDFIFNLKETK